MKFEWKLQPLQRKLEWELDVARSRLAAAAARYETVRNSVQALESSHAAQATAALATARRADPALHAQALGWLAAAETRLQRLRAQCARAQSELEAARAECRRSNERLEVLGALHEEALAQFRYASQRQASKEADFSWLASRARPEAP